MPNSVVICKTCLSHVIAVCHCVRPLPGSILFGVGWGGGACRQGGCQLVLMWSWNNRRESISNTSYMIITVMQRRRSDWWHTKNALLSRFDLIFFFFTQRRSAPDTKVRGSFSGSFYLPKNFLQLIFCLLNKALVSYLVILNLICFLVFTCLV